MMYKSRVPAIFNVYINTDFQASSRCLSITFGASASGVYIRTEDGIIKIKTSPLRS